MLSSELFSPNGFVLSAGTASDPAEVAYVHRRQQLRPGLLEN